MFNLLKRAFIINFLLGVHLYAAFNHNNQFLDECCYKDGDRKDGSDILLKCVKSFLPVSHKSTSSPLRIGIVTYIDDNITSYAAYSLAINTAYALHTNYDFMVLSPETHSDYEPRDPRWNRVKILSKLMMEPREEEKDKEKEKGEEESNEGIGTYSDFDYVVWLDADLAVVDWTLSIERLVEAFPDHDLLLSAEYHAETGVANTGSIIAKNTAWTQSFLQQWWSVFDHSLNHDQVYVFCSMFFLLFLFMVSMSLLSIYYCLPATL
jgi:hypothetical protein